MTRRTLAGSVAVAAALLMAGCAAEDPTVAVPSPTVESPTPSQAPYAVPSTLEGEIARAVFEPDAGADGSPQTSYTAVDLVRADEPFTIEGQCIGDSVEFEVIRAAVGDSGTMLMGGTFTCGENSTPGSYSSPYSGPVQLVLKGTDGIEAGWFAVVPAPAG
ncbi:hypothetical protein GCM10009775_11140 [Microbacterium aoyamense]|uniref:Lipoprotein n=1 Tax=Microbacterium aoyamense TaxID=344166 RepID=A0ABN2PFC9_9MICO|nr:hypothetical protein [Microbacterium aoyamense]